MNKTQLSAICDITLVDELRCHYTALRQTYEELYNGPRNAAAYREYYALRDSERACYNRIVELTQNSHGE